LTTIELTSQDQFAVPRALRHPNKEVDAALAFAEQRGWRVLPASGHAWGRLYCPFNDQACRCGTHCITSVWSTPKNPGNFARQLRRIVENCNGKPGASTEDLE
jgi:hypothetical protein